MVIRSRFALLVVVALALVALPTGAISAGAEALGDAHPVLQAAASSVAPHMAARPSRPQQLQGGAPGAWTSLIASLAGALLLVAGTARVRRRIVDAGYDWRSLLLGAPPAAA